MQARLSEVDDVGVALDGPFAPLLVQDGDFVDVEIGDEGGVRRLPVEVEAGPAVAPPEVEDVRDFLGLLLAVDQVVLEGRHSLLLVAQLNFSLKRPHDLVDVPLHVGVELVIAVVVVLVLQLEPRVQLLERLEDLLPAVEDLHP